MRIGEWEARYREQRRDDDFAVSPTPLVVRWAAEAKAGTALDLACGTGRNALWLARNGWSVTAVDGSETAIATLRARAAQAGVALQTEVADLTSGRFRIEPEHWDLILDCYYLQRDLFAAVRDGVRKAGLVIAIVHLVHPGEAPSEKNAAPGELRRFFADWEILHDFEGAPDDPAHRRAVAEVVVRRPR